jgi:hypothetical protein
MIWKSKTKLPLSGMSFGQLIHAVETALARQRQAWNRE